MSNLAALIREAERMRSAPPFVSPESSPLPNRRASEKPSSMFFSWNEPSPTRSQEETVKVDTVNYDLAEISAVEVKELIDADEEMRAEDAYLSHGASDPGLCLTRSGVEALRAAVAPWPEIMTLCEAARYLRVGRHAILDFVKFDDLPAAKLAGKWRFKRSMLDHWLEIQFSPYR